MRVQKGQHMSILERQREREEGKKNASNCGITLLNPPCVKLFTSFFNPFLSNVKELISSCFLFVRGGNKEER